jgi:hypothetical protein
MVRSSDWSGAWRRVCLTLAALALVLKIAVPPGFMLAQEAGPPSLVICTGHGPLKIADPSHPGRPAPSPGKSDAPCSGAGNVSPLAPPLVSPALAAYAVAQAPVGGAFGVDLAPGRGLAAPPPPSQAPPFSLI